MELAPIPPQAAIVRAWLELQSEPQTVVDIAEALSSFDAGKLARNVHRMWRDGLLARSGKCRSYAFVIARAPVRRERIPRDERLRLKAERERARSRRRIAAGQARSWEAWKAECEARRVAAQVRKAEAQAKRQRARDAERAEREAAREAARRAPKPARAKPAVQPTSARPFVRPAPQPTPVEFESVEAFLRRGGKVIHLEPGACSQPLRTLKEAA